MKGKQYSLKVCQDACIALGECAEVSKASKYCYMAKESCSGTKRTKDQKYLVTGWIPAGAGNHWCAAAPYAQHVYVRVHTVSKWSTQKEHIYSNMTHAR